MATSKHQGRVTTKQELTVGQWPALGKLRRPAVPVMDFNDRLLSLVATMTRVMDDEGGVGLAAPQLGVSVQVALVRHEEHHHPLVLVNPELTVLGDEETLGWEGCLSFRQPPLFVEIPRPTAVRVEAFDVHGEPTVLFARDGLARCVVHELDHLAGRLMIDYLDAGQRQAQRRRRFWLQAPHVPVQLPRTR